MLKSTEFLEAQKSRPKALAGFEHINRYWDKRLKLHAAKILPGEYYVSKQGEIISTVLGSCISACIWDPASGIGGMNHFMLPQSDKAGPDSWLASGNTASTRYGNYAMEHLINTIISNGGNRSTLQMKLFGGAQIIASMTDIGQRNIMFVKDYIHTEGLKVMAEDIGDVYPRKVIFFSDSGRAQMKRLRSLHNDTLISREKSYMTQLETKPTAGDVELF